MNCSDVEPFLDQLTRPSTNLGVDQIAVREHLASCVACQRTLRSLVQWDGQLSQAMNDVTIPAGLPQRLMTALTTAAPSDSILQPETALPRNMWRRAFTSAIMVVLLSISVWGTWRIWKPPMLSPDNVTGILQQPIDNLPTADDSRHLLPRQWSAVKRMVVTGDAKKMELSELRLSLVVFPLEVRSKRGPAVGGSLFVVPKSRWNSANSVAVSKVPVSRSAVQYAPQHIWLAWAEKDSVYLLVLNSQTQLLEQLRSQLGGDHTFL